MGDTIDALLQPEPHNNAEGAVSRPLHYTLNVADVVFLTILEGRKESRLGASVLYLPENAPNDEEKSVAALRYRGKQSRRG